jgi:hypothetical protein
VGISESGELTGIWFQLEYIYNGRLSFVAKGFWVPTRVNLEWWPSAFDKG